MTDIKTIELSGWGRYPKRLCRVMSPSNEAEALPHANAVIPRGQGRSYGDAALLGEGVVVLTDHLNREPVLDHTTGVLTAGSGVTLEKIIYRFLRDGWFPPVVPGTKFVSLGGCVAADIHGKNHHRDGAFGNFVDQLELVIADGSHQSCSPNKNPELFWATVGGMGLTGLMTQISLRMTPVTSSYLWVEHHQTKDLDDSFKALFDPAWDDDYTVAWIDCLARKSGLGRSVLMRGHHAPLTELPRALQANPYGKSRRQFNLGFDFPAWTLNSFSMQAFNELYYRLQARKRRPFVSDYESFFFPLDSIGNWNRVYGRRGFIQYQCVLPLATAYEGLRALLEKLASERRSSFLSVLKRFGAAGEGLLSFPFEGYTLTLDLAVKDDGLFSFLDRLDQIVLEHNGRVYLAKDARLKPDTFRAMYPRFPEWLEIKRRIDPAGCFDSDLARRLDMGFSRRSANAGGEGNS